MIADLPAPAFTQRALCAETDPEQWHPEPGGDHGAAAKKMCNGDVHTSRPPCPAKDECLTYALEHDERYGIWGGTGPSERDRLRRTRGYTPAQLQTAVQRLRGQGLTYGEMAAHLGITITRVRAAISTAA